MLRYDSTIASRSDELSGSPTGSISVKGAGRVRVIIPACNESARIEATLWDYCVHFGDRAEIVVVANGCTDDTVDVVQRFASHFTNLSVLDVPTRIGKGGAVRAGFLIGNEPFVGFVDADGSTSAAEFEKLLLHCAEDNVDGAIGSRWLPDSRILSEQTLARRIASRAFNVLVRLLFNLPYHDTQCGAKVFRREALCAAVTHLELSNFAFDVDLLFNLKKAGASLEEYPIAWSDAFGSTVSLSSAAFSMALALLRVRVLNSVLARVPFIDFIARDSVIPVMKPPSVLVFATTPKPEYPLDPTLVFLLDQIHEWQRHGVTVSWVQPDGPLGLFATFLWYAISGHSRYDVLFEIEARVPRVLPYLSRKPRYLVTTAVGKRRGFVERWLARRIYGRMQKIGPETMLNHAVAIHPSAAGYRAVFHALDNGWSLRYADTASGLVQSLPLDAIEIRYEQAAGANVLPEAPVGSAERPHDVPQTVLASRSMPTRLRSHLTQARATEIS